MDLSKIKISQSFKFLFEEYRKIACQVLAQQNIDFKENDIDIKSYARYLFKEGSNREKTEFVRGLGIPL